MLETTVSNEEKKERRARKYRILLIIVFALSLSLSFGLGYLTAYQTNRAPIVIEKCGEES
jgi:hypothetical protein